MSVGSCYNRSMNEELFKNTVEEAFQTHYGIKPMYLQGYIPTIKSGYIAANGNADKFATTIFNIMVKSYGMNTARKTAEHILYG